MDRPGREGCRGRCPQDDRIYEDEDEDDLVARPPFVTIMGHVDHGKTSLLDYIRNSKVASGEAGGITQAIGAYQVSTSINGEEREITFLDTPGHEAFSAMRRARGARVTDVAIVVVAADDGVRPQTKEAVSHAKAAGVPLIIAINKIDKEGANPDRVKEELAALEVVCEEGRRDAHDPGSAKQGTGVEELLETIALTAEVEELVANPDRNARGTVVEAYLDKKRRDGNTARPDGDAPHGRPPDPRRRQLGHAPSPTRTARRWRRRVHYPRADHGLGGVPMAGEEFDVMDSEAKAREAAEARASADRINIIEGNTVSLSNLAAAKGDEDGVQTINIIVKTDVNGSVEEAVKAALGALPQDRVILRFSTPPPAR